MTHRNEKLRLTLRAVRAKMNKIKQITHRNEKPRLPDNLIKTEVRIHRAQHESGIGGKVNAYFESTNKSSRQIERREGMFSEVSRKRKRVWAELGPGGPYPRSDEIQKRKCMAELLIGTPLEVKVIIYKAFCL